MFKILLNACGAVFFFLIACKSPAKYPFETDFVKLGDSLVQITLDTLSVNLQKQVGLGGFAQAVSYCKLEAENLTSTGSAGAVFIKRATLKPRNTANTADKLEQSQILFFQDLIDRGVAVKAKLVAENTGNIHYFKPIMVQPFCLNCHGNPGNDIGANTLAAIKTHYPHDEAINYKTGDLRGLWHLTFDPFEKKEKK